MTTSKDEDVDDVFSEHPEFSKASAKGQAAIKAALSAAFDRGYSTSEADADERAEWDYEDTDEAFSDCDVAALDKCIALLTAAREVEPMPFAVNWIDQVTDALTKVREGKED